jgi:Zn-dependent protease with chaperone function
MRKRLLAAALGCQWIASLCGSSALAAPSEDDKLMVGVVAARILAQAEPIQGWAWPPRVAISDKDEVNAFATVCEIKPGDTPEPQDSGKLVWIELPEFDAMPPEEALSAADLPGAVGGADELAAEHTPAEHTVETHDDGTVTQPVIVLNQGFLDKVVQGNPDRLAAVFGHEASHILLRQVDAASGGAPLVANMINRQQEADADVLGMKLGLKASFPYKGLVGGVLGMRDQGNYNSFEGLNATHPGWTDRVAMIDDQQKELWHSISAFENGVQFLMLEQYRLAERCFKQVTVECPKCYEAWANLGYTQLMMYCDALREEDLRYFDIGQVVVGGFYRRPESMQFRDFGINEALWLDAVGNLRQAVILNPDLVLAKANLAVAYLVAPDGKDVGKAEGLLRQVREALASGNVEEIDPLVKASLLVNAGVAEMETGDAPAAEALFAGAQELFSADGVDKSSSTGLVNAIRYNRGRMYAAASDPAKKKTAIDELEAYLSSSSPAANWWPLALERYKALCAEAGVEAKPENTLSLAANKQYRTVIGIALPDGGAINLNDSPESLEKTLGEGRAQVLVKKSDVRRLQYAKLGMEILCDQHIVAIRLRGPKAPAVTLQASGFGGETQQVRPGMTLPELDAILGGDANQWDQRYGTNTQVVYRFYTRLGFGVRLSGDKITEVIVAQIPIEAKVQ